MKVYVLTIEDVYDCVSYPHTPEVYKNLEDAQKSLNDWAEEQREVAEENEWEVEEKYNYFESYDAGYWSQGHFIAQIDCVEVA